MHFTECFAWSFQASECLIIHFACNIYNYVITVIVLLIDCTAQPARQWSNLVILPQILIFRIFVQKACTVIHTKKNINNLLKIVLERLIQHRVILKTILIIIKALKLQLCYSESVIQTMGLDSETILFKMNGTCP